MTLENLIWFWAGIAIMQFVSWLRRHLNLNIRDKVVITAIEIWRKDLWDRGWTVRRLFWKRWSIGWRILVWTPPQKISQK